MSFPLIVVINIITDCSIVPVAQTVSGSVFKSLAVKKRLKGDVDLLSCGAQDTIGSAYSSLHKGPYMEGVNRPLACHRRVGAFAHCHFPRHLIYLKGGVPTT